jgi:hypothetical protein
MQELQEKIDKNKREGNSLADAVSVLPMGAGLGTAAHGARGLLRVIGNAVRGTAAEAPPYEAGLIGTGWQGAKVAGGSGLTYGGAQIGDWSGNIIDAIKADMALDKMRPHNAEWGQENDKYSTNRKSGGRVEKKNGGPLNAKRRNALPEKSFAGPDRSYPINDPNHARNALARVANKSPSLKSRVRAAVHRKYPGIGKDKD